MANPILPVDLKRVGSAREVRTDTGSQERDADGRRDRNEEQNKNPLNEEEMKKAKEYLDNLAGLKSNDLTMELAPAGDLQVFLIKNHEGQVIRRILEWEMRLLISDKDKKVGHIFDKAA